VDTSFKGGFSFLDKLLAYLNKQFSDIGIIAKKMRLTILLILIPFLSLKGQEIRYNLFIIDPCEDKIEKSDFFTMKKDSIEFVMFDLDDSTLLLPSFGVYELDSKLNVETKLVNVSKAINSDTLIAPRVQEFVVTHDKYAYRFKNCGKNSHGVEKSYYTDGSLRMIGNFKKGLAIGELKRFYENGEIKEIANYTKKGFQINSTEYHRNGKIRKISTYNKKGWLIKTSTYDDKGLLIEEWELDK
jgi:hypothetical protein